MGMLDKLRGEFIDIIEWTEPAHSEILAYRFPRHNNEIKMGAQLTVREGQNAVFVNEGKLADVFAPGRYWLETQNLPILSTLKGWKYGFSSPFKAEVYFVSMKHWTDQKWGTANPVMMRDPEFGPVRIRAFGTYAMHVVDAGVFIQQVVATEPSFENLEISNQLRNVIVPRITDAIAKSRLPVLELAGNYDKLSRIAQDKVGPDLRALGLGLSAFYVENISLPPEVEKMLDKRSQMSVLGDMGQFTRFQTANAIGDAANNPGGIAGVGAGLGAGMAIAGQMAAAVAGGARPSESPPPLPGAAFYLSDDGKPVGPYDLNTLAAQVQQGALTRATLVWRQGMPAWAAAETIPELQSLLRATPPPLPQQPSDPVPTKMIDDHMTVGTEWLIDAEGCREELLRDLAVIKRICTRILAQLGLHVVGEGIWHQFPEPGGVTGLFLLTQSHLACHTYPEYGLATFNLYCCRPQRDWPWQEHLREMLGAARVTVRRVPRGRQLAEGGAA